MAIFKKELNESEMKQLKTDDLEAVSGGYIHKVRYEGWEIIDDKTGAVLDEHVTTEKSKDRAIELGQSYYQISHDELNDLRKKGKQPERLKGITW